MTENPIPLVLVIEPDAVQRDLIKICLRRIGCEVIIAQDAEEVFQLFAQNHPSLLVLDTFIPGTSGLEIVSDLKQKKLIKHSRILFISSYGFTDIIQKSKDIGVHEFLIKPLDMDEFSKRVKTLLEI